ncbi:MAG: hypothetical protein COY49_00625 [Comamonadaceae bacterium CG_4_10_14_0_8_um_filter_57_29]|nr:MAG: hypothetical protein COY49_00625 [Comamonadaceae bacterium CG_4_10_14_0_8_um_filter_57_29]
MHKQLFIPGFPDGAQRIGEVVSIVEKDGWVTYFVGGDDYFTHPAEDLRSKRFILTSLMENSHLKAADLSGPPLLIPYRTLMNWKSQFRKDGPPSFFAVHDSAKTVIMTPEKSLQCATLLAQGMRVSVVARQTEIQESTLRKAIKRGIIAKHTLERTDAMQAKNDEPEHASTKSERSRIDAQAGSGIGVACTRADERIDAALGLATYANTRFEHVTDVPMAGLLTGLPALCANGLLSGVGKHLSLPKGYYSALHILLLLGFMALGRIRRPEGLRSIPPGEFGKVVGLDRVPEVRTVRQKIGLLATTGNPQAWGQELSQSWMQADPTEAGYLYVDGHIRVYDGKLANLPKRFVSRERLCLHGTTDYWVNDAIGRPFFVVSKTITEGMGDALIKDIVPELLKSVPQQPTQQELGVDPKLHRFVIVFDRECSNYKLLAQLWEMRIGAITYRKNVKDKWPIEEFKQETVPVIGGESTTMMLALRETTLSAQGHSIAVTEVRRLTDTGHQTAIITTAMSLGTTTIASRMFARWCQENFFSYMMQHYDIDGLIEYGAQELPGTTLVINPDHRELERAIKRVRLTLKQYQARLTTYTQGADQEAQTPLQVQKRAECLESIQAVQGEIEVLCVKRKTTDKRVRIDSLPKDKQPTQLLPLTKMFTDTVKMIAYRAETAMVALLKRHLNKEEEARALVRELFISAGDIEPDEVAKTLTVRIHRMVTPAHDKAIAALLEDLNSQDFCHPETGAKIVYALV